MARLRRPVSASVALKPRPIKHPKSTSRHEQPSIRSGHSIPIQAGDPGDLSFYLTTP